MRVPVEAGRVFAQQVHVRVPVGVAQRVALRRADAERVRFPVQDRARIASGEACRSDVVRCTAGRVCGHIARLCLSIGGLDAVRHNYALSARCLVRLALVTVAAEDSHGACWRE